MNICFLCDLHLPACREAIQYRMLEFAGKDILKRQSDCIAFAGDATCDGDRRGQADPACAPDFGGSGGGG